MLFRSNLYLQTSLGPDGNVRRSWTFRYGLDGVRHELGLGSASTFSLKEARERAKALRKQLADHIDPLDHRRTAEQARLAEKAKTVTFERCATMYFNVHEGGWSAEHRRQWMSSLRLYVYPKIGSLPVRDIDQAMIMQIVEPIWRSRTVTAGRVRARIESILNYALAHKFREGDNPAGSILSALPKQGKIAKVEHLAALEWEKMPTFMAEVRGLQSMPAKCCEFLILTAARSGEAIGAKWSEIDLAAKTWTVSADRMKAGAEHRVPLSPAAIELLSGLPRSGPLVFGVNGKVLQETALRRMVLAKLRPGAKRRRSIITTHGFRSAFRDWASERTNFPREVCERALAHAVGTQTSRAYERTDQFTKRARLMEAWSDYLAKAVPATGVVTPLRARA